MKILPTWTEFKRILSGKNTKTLYSVKYKKYSYMKVHESVTVWYINNDLHIVAVNPRDCRRLLKSIPNRFNVYKEDLEAIVREVFKNNKDNPTNIISILSKPDSELYPGTRILK